MESVNISQKAIGSFIKATILIMELKLKLSHNLPTAEHNLIQTWLLPAL